MSLYLQFASLSLGASVDQQTGNLSVFEIVDEIRTPQLPIHIQSLVISLGLYRSDVQSPPCKLVIDLIPPDGKAARIGEGDLQIPPQQRRVKAVFRLANFPVLQFGFYRFMITWNDLSGAKLGEAALDFEVTQVPLAAGSVGNAPPQGSMPH